MRVTFLPKSPGNPYQRGLENALSEYGVEIVRLRQRVLSLPFGLLRRRPDIIHLHWLHYFTTGRWTATALSRYCLFRIGWALFRLFRRRIVWTVHNFRDHEGRNARLERWCTSHVSRRADAIIVHCGYARRQLLERFPHVSPETVHVIPHGNYCEAYENKTPRSDARKRIGLQPGQFVFLFLGQIRSYKGVMELIDAFGTVRDRAARLLIAGRAPEAGTEQKISERVKKDERLDYRPGFVPEAEVQWYMNACDVLVCPYRDVLTSGSVVLASSFARPCVAPRLGCIPEQVEERDSFLYDPDRPGALAEALGRALASRDRLTEMGERSRERASQWSWRRVAQLTLAVYRACQGPQTARRP